MSFLRMSLQREVGANQVTRRAGKISDAADAIPIGQFQSEQPAVCAASGILEDIALRYTTASLSHWCEHTGDKLALPATAAAGVDDMAFSSSIMGGQLLAVGHAHGMVTLVDTSTRGTPRELCRWQAHDRSAVAAVRWWAGPHGTDADRYLLTAGRSSEMIGASCVSVVDVGGGVPRLVSSLRLSGADLNVNGAPDTVARLAALHTLNGANSACGVIAAGQSDGLVALYDLREPVAGFDAAVAAAATVPVPPGVRSASDVVPPSLHFPHSVRPSTSSSSSSVLTPPPRPTLAFRAHGSAHASSITGICGLPGPYLLTCSGGEDTVAYWDTRKLSSNSSSSIGSSGGSSMKRRRADDSSWRKQWCDGFVADFQFGPGMHPHTATTEGAEGVHRPRQVAAIGMDLSPDATLLAVTHTRHGVTVLDLPYLLLGGGSNAGKVLQQPLASASATASASASASCSRSAAATSSAASSSSNSVPVYKTTPPRTSVRFSNAWRICTSLSPATSGAAAAASSSSSGSSSGSLRVDPRVTDAAAMEMVCHRPYEPLTEQKEPPKPRVPAVFSRCGRYLLRSERKSGLMAIPTALLRARDPAALQSAARNGLHGIEPMEAILVGTRPAALAVGGSWKEPDALCVAAATSNTVTIVRQPPQRLEQALQRQAWNRRVWLATKRDGLSVSSDAPEDGFDAEHNKGWNSFCNFERLNADYVILAFCTTKSFITGYLFAAGCIKQAGLRAAARTVPPESRDRREGLWGWRNWDLDCEGPPLPLKPAQQQLVMAAVATLAPPTSVGEQKEQKENMEDEQEEEAAAAAVMSPPQRPPKKRQRLMTTMFTKLQPMDGADDNSAGAGAGATDSKGGGLLLTPPAGRAEAAATTAAASSAAASAAASVATALHDSGSSSGSRAAVMSPVPFPALMSPGASSTGNASGGAGGSGSGKFSRRNRSRNSAGASAGASE